MSDMRTFHSVKEEFERFLEQFDGKPAYGYDKNGYCQIELWDDRSDMNAVKRDRVFVRSHKDNIIYMTGEQLEWDSLLQGEVSSTATLIGYLINISAFNLQVSRQI